MSAEVFLGFVLDGYPGNPGTPSLDTAVTGKEPPKTGKKEEKRRRKERKEKEGRKISYIYKKAHIPRHQATPNSLRLPATAADCLRKTVAGSARGYRREYAASRKRRSSAAMRSVKPGAVGPRRVGALTYHGVLYIQ